MKTLWSKLNRTTKVEGVANFHKVAKIRNRANFFFFFYYTNFNILFLKYIIIYIKEKLFFLTSLFLFVFFLQALPYVELQCDCGISLFANFRNLQNFWILPSGEKN